MKALFLALAVAFTALPSAAANLSLLQDTGGSATVCERLFDLMDPGTTVLDAACCKTCSKGLACGDTCISRDKTCNVGPGCACQAPGS